MGRRHIDRAAVPRNKTITDWDDINDETLYITKFEGIDDGEVLHCIRNGEAIEVLGHPRHLSKIIREELGLHAVYESKYYGIKLVAGYVYSYLMWKDFKMEILDNFLPGTYSTPGCDYEEYR